MADDLAQNEQQLAEIEELLKQSPDDHGLLALKRDVLELINLTKGGGVAEDPPSAAVQSALADLEDNDEKPVAAAAAPQPPIDEVGDAAAVAAVQKPKKLKKVKDFQVPEHLIPLDTDTEAEKNKKRRAIKALKSKHRAKQKEFTTNKKQQSWQSFQQKTKKKRKDESIFKTQEGVNAKVGVISTGSMTEFDSRKRHKH